MNADEVNSNWSLRCTLLKCWLLGVYAAPPFFNGIYIKLVLEFKQSAFYISVHIYFIPLDTSNEMPATPDVHTMIIQYAERNTLRRAEPTNRRTHMDMDMDARCRVPQE